MDQPRPTETVNLPQRGWQITPSHALTAGALCWLGFGVMAWAVHNGMTVSFDHAGLLLWRTGADLRFSGAPWLTEAVRDITALGGTVLRIVFGIAALTALLLLGMRREAVLMLATLLSGALVEVALKALVGRPRPQIVPHLTEAAGMSFPSGHSFNSALGFIAIALAFATLSNRRVVRWAIIGFAIAASISVALSRVWLGVHYPRDAIAGWLGGAGWAFLASTLLYKPAKVVADRAADRAVLDLKALP